MVLVPLLGLLANLDDRELFPASISIILPICLVSLGYTALRQGLDLSGALPYLLGSVAGGVLVGLVGRRIPTLWLHRFFGIMILWGGIRYLW